MNKVCKYLRNDPNFVQRLSSAEVIKQNIHVEFSANPTKKNKLMLKFMGSYKITLDDFKYMIDLGANPQDNIDILMELSLLYQSTDIATFLIDEYKASIINKTYHCSINNFKMLLERELITDEYIDQCFYQSSPDKLEILLEHNITIRKIIERFIISSNKNKSFIFIICHYLTAKITETDEYLDPILLSKFLTTLAHYYPSGLITIDFMQKLIMMGLDIHCDDDLLFLNIINLNNLSLVKFFVEDLGCDINTHDSMALVTAIRYSRSDIIEYLLDSEIKITDNALTEIFIIDEPKFYQLLLKYYDRELLAQKYLLYKKQTHILKIFIDAGIDITKMVSDL